jgi:hypothetical protein
MDNALKDMDVLASANTAPEQCVHAEPHGELEAEIAQLWRAAFRLETIGRDDNFFGLGGNSLLGMELSELFATRLALEIPVVLIFQNPTIRELASLIESAR